MSEQITLEAARHIADAVSDSLKAMGSDWAVEAKAPPGCAVLLRACDCDGEHVGYFPLSATAESIRSAETIAAKAFKDGMLIGARQLANQMRGLLGAAALEPTEG